MKKVILIFSLIFLVSFVSAQNCNLDASLINQDPYPAVPGDYVKLVFQLSGVENSNCGQVTFKLLQSYPLIFDPETDPSIIVQAGTFARTYSSSLLAPYKVRIDEDALEGENTIEVEFSYQGAEGRSTKVKQFNLQIDDVKVTFEVTIKDYDPSTNTLTFEILNTGESDIEALTIEIPEQENVNVKGPYRNIVGDLDSNDYTTADFEAVPKDGEITLDILYTDSINTRRTTESTVVFDSSYFQDRAGSQKGTSIWTYLILLIIVIGVIWWWRRRKKKKEAAKYRH